jgi:TetR/AcrR family transcriptional repressor of nem operon
MGRPRQFDVDTAVESALEIFWKHGYATTTPAELVDAIGVGKGSFYNAFESKHGIFERALQRYGDDRVSGLAVSLSGSGSIRQRITRYLARLGSPEQSALLRRGCFAANTAAELGGRDPATTKIVRDTFQRMERVLGATLGEAQEQGELARTLDTKAVATLFLAALVGMTVIARVDEPTPYTKRIARAFAALL